MSVVTDYAEELAEGLSELPGFRLYRDAASIDSPPAVYVGPPLLTWDGFDSDPTTATFTVYIVVPASDRAQEQLQDVLPAVATAVDRVPDAVVKSARPGIWKAGSADLPTYEMSVHVSLGGHP